MWLTRFQRWLGPGRRMPGFQPLWPRTSRSNGPGFAVLAPAAERGRWAAMKGRAAWNRTRAPESSKHPTKPGRVTVSGQLGDDMPKGTLASVKRQAGLKGDRS